MLAMDALTCTKLCACMQAADVKMGAINIRSEEGVTPEAVLAGFSRAEQEEVREPAAGLSACLCMLHCYLCSPRTHVLRPTEAARCDLSTRLRK